MVLNRDGFFRFRAFWLTAGLSAGAATWVHGVEPAGQPVFLQPVPSSSVVQTQAQGSPQQLRTQQPAAAGQGARPAGPKSDVQRKLEELYQQDGRQMPDLPDPQIPRQTPGQPAGPTGGGQPQSGTVATPVSSTTAAYAGAAAGQPAAGQPEYKTWAEAQSAGAPRSSQGKKVPWIEQINPFKKKVATAPPVEPPEIHYDPRHAGGQFAAQTPAPVAPQPVLRPGQINPQTGRPNYSQIFGQPQTFGADNAQLAPTQGDPFVTASPMTVAATPQLSPPQAPPVAFAPAQPIAAQPQTPFIPAPAAAPQPQAGFVPAPAAAPPQVQFAPAGQPAAILIPQATAQPAAATPPSSLPILDFSAPAPTPPAAAPAPVASFAPIPQAAPPVQLPMAAPAQPSDLHFVPPVPLAAAATQTAQLPLVLPQGQAGASNPQPPVAGATPFTGLGLNDEVPAAPPALAPMTVPVITQSVTIDSDPFAQPAPPMAPAAPPAAPPVVVAQVPVVPVPVAPSAVPAAVPQVAVAPAPVAASVPRPAPPASVGFFSDEEEQTSDQPKASVAVEQPRPLVVPTPPAEEPKFTVPNPVPVAAAPPAFPAAEPAASPPRLELPPLAASAAPAPAPAPALPPANQFVPPAQAAPLKPVPQPDAAASSKMARIAARGDQRGLKGFCPVMLRDHRELVDARAEHRSFYRNRIILLSSHEAKVVFESDPAKYAPASSGNDVIHLSQTGEELEGTLEFAVWYKGRLYLFASAETLEAFVAAPSSHATNE